MIKKKVLNWVKRFDTFCFLDNHLYQIHPHTQECLVGAGLGSGPYTGPGISRLDGFLEGQKGNWIFGHLSYDLKNEIESLHSSHPDHILFPDIFFFRPEILISINEKELSIECRDPGLVFREISRSPVEISGFSGAPVKISNRIRQDEYLSIIRILKHHILRGDCYEINFCQEFFCEQTHINPLEVYYRLIEISPNPFSALYRLGDKWLICASPERYLKKSGERILSQPIKGTSKRILEDRHLDGMSREHLLHSQKEKSENVMVVDLVRNDLAKICSEGTVKVDELFGVYSFPQVHQMISTISGDLEEGITFCDIIRASFPMGSMTGAPKLRVMELIEKYEKTRRGIFSGAVGYFSPDGDFDFNVVIRSIMYNAKSGYLSFQTGSGITFGSDPQQEWDECQLKAEAIRKVICTPGY